jgi:hypothetical protein
MPLARKKGKSQKICGELSTPANYLTSLSAPLNSVSHQALLFVALQ